MSFHVILSWFEVMEWEQGVIPMYCRFVGYNQVHVREKEDEKNCQAKKYSNKWKDECVCLFLRLYLILFIHH